MSACVSLVRYDTHVWWPRRFHFTDRLRGVADIASSSTVRGQKGRLRPNAHYAASTTALFQAPFAPDGAEAGAGS